MQDCMFDTAHVLVYRHPVVRFCRVEYRSLIRRIGIAKEIPGRIDKRIHGIGFPFRRSTASGTGNVEPVF